MKRDRNRLDAGTMAIYRIFRERVFEPEAVEGMKLVPTASKPLV